MNEYALDVVCDHYLHPAVTDADRTVCQVYYLSTPDTSIAAFANWREAKMETEPGYPSAKTTYFDRLRELTQNMEPGEVSGIMRDPAARARLLTSRGSGRVMQAAHWRFWCRDCGDTLETTQTNAERVFEGLRALDRKFVTLQQFRDLVRRVSAPPQGTNW